MSSQPPGVPDWCGQGSFWTMDVRPSPSRLICRLKSALIAAGLSLLAPGVLAGQDVSEYDLKAALLLRIPEYVVWPGDPDRNEFVIGVLGSDPFGGVLTELEQKTVGGQPVRVQRFDSPRAVSGVQLLFVSLPDGEVGEALQALSAQPVLTVGDQPDFTDQGGMIGMTLSGNRISLEVNRCASQEARLRISAQLLRVASSVVECTMAARR